MSSSTTYPPADVAAVDPAGDCVVCGRPAAAPYRRTRTEVGIERVVEGCVARAHVEAGVADPWALATQEERRLGTEVAARRLTRSTARRGEQVRVQLRDGRPDLVGTLTGWGSQIIEVAPAERVAPWSWKRESVPVAVVAQVTAVSA